MLWEEYYDKLADWATSTAVSRMSKLESFGPPAEIIDAINQIGFDDEKGATRLLKKATAAGVKFTGEQLSELFLICEEAEINRAIRFSADRFRTEDLDALYGFCDEIVLVDLAKRWKLRLLESLREYAQAFAPNPEIHHKASRSTQSLAAEYDYILDCLRKAHELLKKAYQFSLIDTSGKERAATVVKYACIADAQSYISRAQQAWDALEIPEGSKQPLRGIWPNISNSTMWKNFLLEGFFTNLMVKRQIHRVLKNIETAYDRIRRLRSAC